MSSQSQRPITTTGLVERPYTWQPRPVNIWVSMEPYYRLQARLLDGLRRRLEANGCLFVERPDQPTELGPVAHLGISFGRDLEQEVSPMQQVGRMPKPRGMMLIVNAVEHIPENIRLFDLARGQLVRKSGHIGVLLEGELDGSRIRRALWASMPGNNSLLSGEEDTILDQLALRVQAHVSAEKVNEHAGDIPAPFTWQAWCDSPVHGDIAQAARTLGRAGIIEDEVLLEHYATSSQVQAVLRFLKRAALGEGMRSQLDPALGVMGITTTGGNKINVSPDPRDGHVIPIGQLTWTGYVRAIPPGCPIDFVPPSVETHENGMVYLAGALAKAGLVSDLDGFLGYLADHFARHEWIDILPSGLEPKILVIDHFHRQPRAGSIREPNRVEIVYPDTSRFPEIDFPCGVREAELHLLSALFRSEWFRSSEPLGKRAIIAVLPGHGSVALYGGPRHELTDLLVNGMEMEEIVRI